MIKHPKWGAMDNVALRDLQMQKEWSKRRKNKINCEWLFLQIWGSQAVYKLSFTIKTSNCVLHFAFNYLYIKKNFLSIVPFKFQTDSRNLDPIVSWYGLESTCSPAQVMLQLPPVWSWREAGKAVRLVNEHLVLSVHQRKDVHKLPAEIRRIYY